MRKEDKATAIEQIKAYVAEYPNFYLTDIEALNADLTSRLRRECNKNGIKLFVVKNTLMRRALSESDVFDFAELYGSLKGNTAVMFSHTANAPAKVIKDFLKENKELGKPGLKAAFVQESIYVGAENLDALVNIKSREELIADVVALLEAPIMNVISSLESGAQTIHGVLDTLEKK